MEEPRRGEEREEEVPDRVIVSRPLEETRREQHPLEDEEEEIDERKEPEERDIYGASPLGEEALKVKAGEEKPPPERAGNGYALIASLHGLSPLT